MHNFCFNSYFLANYVLKIKKKKTEPGFELLHSLCYHFNFIVNDLYI